MIYTFWTEGFWTFNLGHNTGWVVLHLGGLLIKVIVSKIFSFHSYLYIGEVIQFDKYFPKGVETTKE